MSETVTTHDIEANGKTYILEWTHSEDGEGHIAITETCQTDLTEQDVCDESHEFYDFKEVTE